MFLVDTDVISEARKGDKANAGVRKFFDSGTAAILRSLHVLSDGLSASPGKPARPADCGYSADPRLDRGDSEYRPFSAYWGGNSQSIHIEERIGAHDPTPGLVRAPAGVVFGIKVMIYFC